MAKYSIELTTSVRFCKANSSLLQKLPWVAVRGRVVLGTFETFALAFKAAMDSRLPNECTSAIYHRDDEPITLFIPTVFA
jgi:hypothetical protein